MTTWSWVAPGVMLGFMKARSGHFTGLFLPPCPPLLSLSVCLSLSKHIASRTAVTQETLVPFILRTISNMGQVYFWGIVCLSQGALVAYGDRLESAPKTPAHLFPGAPWRGGRTGPLARVLTSPWPCPQAAWNSEDSASSLPRCPHTHILGSTPRLAALASLSPNKPKDN